MHVFDIKPDEHHVLREHLDKITQLWRERDQAILESSKLAAKESLQNEVNLAFGEFFKEFPMFVKYKMNIHREQIGQRHVCSYRVIIPCLQP